MTFKVIIEIFSYSEINQNYLRGYLNWCVISYFFSDVAIFVYIIQIKCPVEFFLYCPPKQNGKTFDEILKWN